MSNFKSFVDDCLDKKCLKLIVDTNSYVHRGEKLTIVKIAGYIYPYDMKNSKYRLIQ